VLGVALRARVSRVALRLANPPVLQAKERNATYIRLCGGLVDGALRDDPTRRCQKKRNFRVEVN